MKTHKVKYYARQMKICYKEYKKEWDEYYKRQWKSLLLEWAKKFISEIKK